MVVNQRVHHHDVLALGCEHLNHLRLTLLVAGVVHQRLVALAVALFVFLRRQELTRGRAVDNGFLYAAEELLVADAAVLDERMNVLPVFLVILALRVELAHQAIRHLAGDVIAHLAHVAIVLQERTGHVQRQVRAVDHALEQHQELRNDLLDVVRHEHLVVIQLDHALAGRELVLQLREVQNALQVERELRVQVNPEQRVVVVVEYVVVELPVFLVGALVGLLHPQRMHVVHQNRRDVLGLLLFFAFFALLGLLGLHDLAHIDFNRHERAILLQHRAHRPHVREFLVLVVQIQDDARAFLGSVAVLDLVGHAVLARPAHGLRAFLAALRVDDNLLGHHERAVEAQTEVTDDAALVALLRLILLQKFLRAGKRDLTDVFLDFVRGHADAVVRHGQRARILVAYHVHAVRLARRLFAARDQHLVFRNGVAAVGNDLSQKNIFIGIQPLFNHGHDILCMNGNAAFFSHEKSLPFGVDSHFTPFGRQCQAFLALIPFEC